MCGISGIMHFSDLPVRGLDIQKMCDLLAHRGPDSSGKWVDGSVGFGHCRLSIIDTSAAGRQPMTNEDETVWISYNGEIYNFRDIRNSLIKLGHVFRSQTDTEVVVHAYEEWGVNCLAHFNGMFAFALWDSKRRRLWLVRDRLGIKPLFYAYSKDAVVFGSEIKAILVSPFVSQELDLSALSYFLAMNWTPAPLTLFKAVKQLLPGHFLLFDTDGVKTECRYWELESTCEAEASDKQWQDRFSTAMEEAVGAMLVSDVPFGAFLSGGVDSSAILYWMTQRLSRPPKAFTIGFAESSYDETPYARSIAQTFGADHFVETIKADSAQILPELVWHSEEPTADSSMLPMYYLARLARKHVKMVLCGDGADEILAGYETYQASLLAPWYRCIPSLVRQKVLMPFFMSLPVSHNKVSWEQKVKRFIAGAEVLPGKTHGAWRIICDAELRRRLMAPIWGHNDSHNDILDLYQEHFDACPMREPLNRLLWVDTRFYLPNDMLVKVDRMSMAHGLEVRVPFLDHRVVEMCVNAPPNLKLRYGFKKKYLLKQVVKEKIPARILRRKKAGFNVPISVWLNGPMRSFVRDTLSPRAVRESGLLDAATVARMLDEHDCGKADYGHQIWGLLVLILWLNCFQKCREQIQR